ncbi:dihydropteroate synthase, partial [Bacillus sp. JCM 19041]|uniref:dihydropteroate synthase n=1 Tax=Bacillus sp. JCM 19041 TaxID=1460637 RepID=UPI0006CF440F
MARTFSLQVQPGSRTKIMGILNATPDSFSDGGRYNEADQALKRAEELIEAGADILDIGGESTRPGYTPVSVEEELERIIPVIEKVSAHFDTPISVDTYKAKTAEAAVLAGASIINDIWGAKADPEMAAVTASLKVPIVLMHNRHNTKYVSFMDDVKEDLRESVQICVDAGVSESNIWLDPGVGFAKSYEQNLQIMRELDHIVGMGYPVLLGTSRKSLIAETLHLPANDRLEGTGATVCLGIAKGVG